MTVGRSAISGGLTLVAMMEAAHFREGHDLALVWPLNPPSLGSILVQTQVRAPVVIIPKVASQEAVQMSTV